MFVSQFRCTKRSVHFLEVTGPMGRFLVKGNGAKWIPPLQGSDINWLKCVLRI